MTENAENDARKGDKWGFAVCFGTVITFIAGIGHINSFGLVYSEFMKNTASTAKSITIAHGVFAMMLAVGGITLDILSKRFPLSSVGLMGALIMIAGSLSTVFVSNTDQLSLTFGVLQGIGFGIMVPVCYATLNIYFTKKKRTTVMSVCKALQGVVLMWWPHLIRFFMNTYGFRGTLLLISGIAFHTLPGMLLMKTDFKKLKTLKPANANVENGKASEPEHIDLLNLERENDLVNDNNREAVLKKGDSKINYELLEILNWRLLKDPVYCNICFGQSFVNFSDLTFFILQPLLLLQYGFETSQVAICISVCGISDVAGRCGLALVSYFLPIDTRILYYLSTLLTLIFRLVMLQISHFTGMVMITVCLGVLRACLHVASPVVISNHVTHKDFPGAYALFMLSAGLVNVAFSPLIGQLRDSYMDYVPAFYALALCCVPCLVFWPIEYFVRKRQG